MEAEARYTFVGASVLVLVAALVAALVWLAGVGGRDNFERYAIHFEKQALDGLEIGADVRLRGIKVGRVDDYSLWGSTSNRVRVAVRIDRRAPVRTNTVAVVTRNFVTGIAAITLVNPDPQGFTLEVVPDGETYPVITEGRSDLDEIAGRVNKVGEMASAALTNINELLDAENRAALMDTVRNLRDLSAGLEARLGALDTTLARVGAGAAELGRSSGRIAAVAERGGERLDGTLLEAERALVEARKALQQVAQSTAAIQQQAVATALRLEDTAASVDDQLSLAVTELRASIETATRVLDRLREPRAALLGPNKLQLGPGEKLP
jgi:phospholipid/cholesterol/gamma-HCH transport system substrate-binding protein